MPQLRLELTSTPFAGDPPGAELYYERLGRALALWGRFENHLDKLLWAICLTDEGRPLEPPSWPRAMKKKAELWRALFRNLPSLASIAPHHEALIKDAMAAAQDRHVLAHAHFAEFSSEDPLVGKFQHTRRKGQKIIFETHQIPLESLEELCSAFDNLNTRIIPITMAVLLRNPPGRRPKSPK